MAIDLVAPYDKLVALLTALPGMQKVYEGVPETLVRGVNAYIAVTAQELVDRYAGGVLENTATFFVGLTYAVRSNDQESTERALLAALVELMRALVAARKSDLDGTVESLTWDFSLANDPAYTVSANREFRIFPVLIRVKQTDNL